MYFTFDPLSASQVEAVMALGSIERLMDQWMIDNE